MTAPDFADDANLAQYFLFDRLGEGLGGSPAILFGDRRWTYADVADRTRRMASLLEASGIRRGERVLQFRRWSDGGSRLHRLQVSGNTTVTASYRCRKGCGKRDG